MDCTALGTRKYGPVVPIFRKGIKMVAISGGRKEKREREGGRGREREEYKKPILPAPPLTLF